jgi:hypothetical protein
VNPFDISKDTGILANTLGELIPPGEAVELIPPPMPAKLKYLGGPLEYVEIVVGIFKLFPFVDISFTVVYELNIFTSYSAMIESVMICGGGGVEDERLVNPGLLDNDKPLKDDDEDEPTPCAEEDEPPPGGAEEDEPPPGGAEEDEPPPGGAEEDEFPPGGAEEDEPPPGGAEEDEFPPGGAEEDEPPPGGAEEDEPPSGGAEEDEPPPGGAEEDEPPDNKLIVGLETIDDDEEEPDFLYTKKYHPTTHTIITTRINTIAMLLFVGGVYGGG